ncbi:CoxG family protein [Tuwongella immobilis]|uniref:: COXG n=1 Tax=Tuwongella immobilis TaxID=692036 RepID=A0A6C2YU25_9BACT|nr:SRPBCC domain-containing protein [Tuwongella immobilis]VIP04934.1 : COXG [Tuwongella immobilis]VTS07226.1 : COXG [Tuwongella immobilis]
MLQFSGERRVMADLADVYAKLGDASFVVGSLPGGDQPLSASAESATWKLKPPVSFVQGLFETILQVVERSEGRMIRTEMRTSGMGAKATVASRIELDAHPEGGTRIRWQSTVTSLEGLLKMVPKSAIQRNATPMMEQSWDDLERRLAQ